MVEESLASIMASRPQALSHGHRPPSISLGEGGVEHELEERQSHGLGPPSNALDGGGVEQEVDETQSHGLGPPSNALDSGGVDQDVEELHHLNSRGVEQEGEELHHLNNHQNGGLLRKKAAPDCGNESMKRKTQSSEGNATNKRKKHLFIYGNYDRYYGYRIDQALDEDPRMKCFKKEWFEGKDCLDIGCNTGNLTIDIAHKFSCKSMLGIDIDPALVGRARNNLKAKARTSQGRTEDGQLCEVAGLEIGSVEERIQIVEGASSSEASIDPSSSSLHGGLSGEELLRRVKFTAENFIECLESDATYDTVLCLSITKWVHLNWGDDGLIRLFVKIMRLLRPGGILVLEPQPWKSYQNKHLVSAVSRKNFNEVVLRPKDFKEVLLDKIGYRSMEKITHGVPNSNTGFNRPIFLIHK